MADPATALERVFAPDAPPLAGALAAGPYNFQFTGEDNIRVTVVNSLAGARVTVAYRTAPTPTTVQTNEQNVGPTSDRIASTTDFSIGTGYLLNLTAYASSGAPKIGNTFVKVDVIRGMGQSAKILATIVAGYITATQPIAWPGSPIRHSLEGQGLTRVISGTDPAAGVGIGETVPSGARWRLHAARATLVTSGVAGNRTIFLLLVTPSVVGVFLSWQSLVQAATQTNQYYWGLGMPLSSVPPSNSGVGGLPDLPILAGSSISIGALQFDVGDNWGPPTLSVEEWLEVD